MSFLAQEKNGGGKKNGNITSNALLQRYSRDES